VVAQLVRASDS